jgi:hypothetical protein
VPNRFAPLVRSALGLDVSSTERLRGGSKKGVYRLVLEDGSTVVGYVWSAAESHWPEASEPYPFDDTSGPDRSARHTSC